MCWSRLASWKGHIEYELAQVAEEKNRRTKALTAIRRHFDAVYDDYNRSAELPATTGDEMKPVTPMIMVK